MTSHIQAPRGTRDVFGPDAEAFARLESVARRVFAAHHYTELRTPIFEAEELFARSLGAGTDIVAKEMFVFEDRGGRRLALRPEGTAGVVRHFIEQSLAVKKGVHRLFYMGPMFRAERPQAGRYRQFWQIGSELFGPGDPAADADTVLMMERVLTAFGLSRFSIHVNSLGCPACRPAYRTALLGFLKTREGTLTEESRQRMAENPLRVLDSKEDGPKLGDAPVMTDFLCPPCAAHHATFRGLLARETDRIEENPRLVRGLDYYTRSVFEVVSPDLGAQSALAAGGRYDALVTALGGPAVPGVGFALGMDRVVAAVGVTAGPAEPDAVSAVVMPMTPEAVPNAFHLAEALRRADVRVPPVAVRKKIKSALSDAVDAGARWAFLMGEQEMAAGTVAVKDLSLRTQETVPLSDAVGYVQKKQGEVGG